MLAVFAAVVDATVIVVTRDPCHKRKCSHPALNSIVLLSRYTAHMFLKPAGTLEAPALACSSGKISLRRRGLPKQVSGQLTGDFDTTEQ